MNSFVEATVKRAVAGIPPSRQEAIALLDVDTFSPEAFHILWGAHQLAVKASRNTGQIFAQIGVDASPCPQSCRFCDFAIDNVEKADRRDVPLSDIIAYAQAFEKAGVHMISVMATAGMDFERYLAVITALRDALSTDMPLMCNVGDLDCEQARSLRQAGIQVAYHAVRIGEGDITDIDPLVRLATIEHIHEAGLKLASGVEPVYEGLDPHTLVDHMVQTASFKPYFSGVCALTIFPGSAMADYRTVSRARAKVISAVFRLIVGTAIPFGIGGNIVWADAGTNPRGRDLCGDLAFLKYDVIRLRKHLVGEEWHVSKQPLPAWFEDDRQTRKPHPTP